MGERVGYMGIAVAAVRFLGKPKETGTPWQKMVALAGGCGYCGTDTSVVRATFDHIRPDSAEGGQSRSNGVVACSPCNAERGNVPFLNYLEGERGQYQYQKTPSGTFVRVENRSANALSHQVSGVQEKFAHYFQKLVQNHQKFFPTWFADTLDNMVYPTWKRGYEPQDEAVKTQQFQRQLQRLFEIVAPHDKTFWLGSPFSDIAHQTLSGDKLKAVVQALESIREPVKSALRFGFSRIQSLGRTA